MKGEDFMKWNKNCTICAIACNCIGAGIIIYTDGFTNDKTENVMKTLKGLVYTVAQNILMLNDGK